MKDIIELTKKVERKRIFTEPKKLDYSLMPLIYKKIKTKELLHSDIIASLMKRSQTLEKSDVFFENFFNMINLESNNIKTQMIKIENEYPVSIIKDKLSKKYKTRYIDILLTWDKNAIIIENKLNNAGDQPTQIKDYYNSINKKGYNVLKVVYIPNHVTKHAPKNKEEEIQKKLIEIYPSNLIEWISNVKNSRKITDINLKRELTNYINLLNYIEMENKRIEENFELSELLSEDKNILTAYKIYERWNDIKWHTEWEFWNDLKNLIKNLIKKKYKNCRILDFQKYSAEKIGGATHKNRNIDYFYGLAFSIAKIKDDKDLCLYIERGDGNMYYGLMIKGEEYINDKKKDKWIVNDDNFQKTIKSLLSSVDGVESRTNWLGIKYFEPAINFKAFNDKNTLLLKEKEHRKKCLEKYITDIEDFLFKVKEKLKEKSISFKFNQ